MNFPLPLDQKLENIGNAISLLTKKGTDKESAVGKEAWKIREELSAIVGKSEWNDLLFQRSSEQRSHLIDLLINNPPKNIFTEIAQSDAFAEELFPSPPELAAICTPADLVTWHVRGRPWGSGSHSVIHSAETEWATEYLLKLWQKIGEWKGMSHNVIVEGLQMLQNRDKAEMILRKENWIREGEYEEAKKSITTYNKWNRWTLGLYGKMAEVPSAAKKPALIDLDTVFAKVGLHAEDTMGAGYASRGVQELYNLDLLSIKEINGKQVIFPTPKLLELLKADVEGLWK